MAYISLSINSISKFNDGLKQISDYQNDIGRKAQAACERLAREGVVACVANSGTAYGSMIQFSVQPSGNNTNDFSEVYLVGEDLRKIFRTWVVKDGSTKQREISPLLMAEFGSGLKAENPLGVEGVGTGTHPVGGHGTEPIWFWKEEKDGAWHHSTGLRPTQPMFKSRNQMMVMCATVFREVFN